MSSKYSTQAIYRLAIILLLFSGAAALGHQLMWTRRLTDLLGASTESSVRVFSCFFCGLGLGSALAAFFLERIRRPFLTLAKLEIGILLLTVPILFLPKLTDWIWPTIGPEQLQGWLGSTIKLLVSLLLILPPATLMGFSFPLVIKGVLTKHLTLARHGINLYAFNTAGGVIGLIVLSGFAISQIGASWSMLLTMAVNAALGLAFWHLHAATYQESAEPSLHEKENGSRKRFPHPTLLAIAALSGAGVIAAEVAAFKMYSLVATSAFHTPTALLIAVISVLALSAWLLRPFVSLCRKVPHAISISAALTGICLALAPVIYMSIVTQQHPYEANASVSIYVLKFVAVTLLTIGPAILFAGILFPASLRWLEDLAPDRGNNQLGWLLAVNGLGGLFGAEITYRFLLPYLGVHQTLGLIGLCYAVGAGLLFFQSLFRSVATVTISTLGLVLVIALFFLKLPTLPHVNLHSGMQALEEKNGREGHLAVIEGRGLGRAIILSNQYVLGSESAKPNQERQAHLPLLLHPEPQTVGFIGHATGMTPGAALLHSSVKHIDSLEISQSVVEAATDHFADLNHNVALSPRAHVIVEDGRTYFASCQERFDVVEGDLFLPWNAGVGRLYSHEHFASVHRALRPGGLFCQWLPMFQLTPGQFDVIANTFSDSFPQTHLFRVTFETSKPGLALVGFKDSNLDWNVIARRCAEVRADNRIHDPSMRHRDGLAMLYLGAYQKSGETPLNTLDNLWLELDAARERLTGNHTTKYLTGERFLVWLRDHPFPVELDEKSFSLKKRSEVGLNFSEWEKALRSRNRRKAESLESDLFLNFPPVFLRDRAADWKQWPGLKPPGT